jgi:hypothetical protein
MKTKSIVQLAAALLLSTINHQLSTCFAQGSLTPPGAPAPTMKSLDQIEARTAITNTTTLATILQPGSYYLTRNLAVTSGDAIDIATNGVTLDLNGFTISSTAASASGNGISLNGLRNITIANGSIQGGVTNNGSGIYGGSGFGYGIYGGAVVNVLVSRVSVSGCLYSGVYLGTGNSTAVESCTVRTAGGYGIYASIIKSCSAADCGSTAINGDQASDCRGQCTGSGYGLSATTAQNCYGYASGSGGNGLSATTAQNCFGYSNSGYGVSASSALNCYGQSSSSYGLSAYTAQNCYAQSSSSIGLYANGSATGCYGYSGGSSSGISAYAAQNCYGYSNSSSGIYAGTAQNCYGQSSSGDGVFVWGSATGCYGYSSFSTGLYAYIANSCSGTSVSYAYHYNMP